MIQIIYDSGNKDEFEIIGMSGDYVIYEDNARNRIKINRKTLQTYIFIDEISSWKNIELNIKDFKVN